MKKAFTSAFSSFTDKLKNKMEGLDDFGDDLDTMSIRTDTSDDDFEHMSLDDLEEVPAFFHEQPPPDLQPAEDSYSEIIDPGDSISVYAESSTTKGKEMVSASGTNHHPSTYSQNNHFILKTPQTTQMITRYI